jgi:peptidyl-prolyl cis-trans isomerase C
MRSKFQVILPTLLACWMVGAAVGQDQPTTQPTTTTAPAEDEVAVIINGDRVMESEVEEEMQARLRNAPLSPEQMEQMRARLRPRVVDLLINDHLINGEVKANGLKIVEKELQEAIQKELRSYLAQTGMSREDFAQRIRQATGKSLEEFLQERAKEESFREAYLQVQYIKQKYPDEVKVTDEEVQASYDEDVDARYKKPAEVRASHILIDTRQAKNEEERQAALAKAKEVLAEVKKEDADFAALAKEHSACPSSARGGDLGFFPRHGRGAMVEPFGAAAFDLKVGEISDVVETQFGYHIIKVTERHDAETTPLEQVAPAIRAQLEQQKVGVKLQERVNELREAATIEYPPGKEPPPPAPPTMTPMTRPATQPAGG